jgi:hypothetical protein
MHAKYVFCLLPFAFVAGAASAQNRAWCAGPLPFPVTDANRVAANDLRKLFAGRTIEALRRGERPAMETPQGHSPATKVERKFSMQWRADGSFSAACEDRTGAIDAFKPCMAWGTEATGSREVGVWQIADGLLCFRPLRIRSGQEACLSVHRAGGRYVAKLVNGPGSCLEGEFLFK